MRHPVVLPAEPEIDSEIRRAGVGIDDAVARQFGQRRTMVALDKISHVQSMQAVDTDQQHVAEFLFRTVIRECY